jgi:hypothetical protein
MYVCMHVRVCMYVCVCMNINSQRVEYANNKTKHYITPHIYTHTPVVVAARSQHECTPAVLVHQVHVGAACTEIFDAVDVPVAGRGHEARPPPLLVSAVQWHSGPQPSHTAQIPAETCTYEFALQFGVNVAEEPEPALAAVAAHRGEHCVAGDGQRLAGALARGRRRERRRRDLVLLL